MPKTFSDEECAAVIQLSQEGLSYMDIAKRMAEIYPVNWNNKSGHRSVARIVKKHGTVGKNEARKSEKTLDEMSRDERFLFISDRLRTTPRFRMAFEGFSVPHQDVFIDEYLKIIKATDTLTEIEEQSLFTAILEFILALQCLARKQREEDLYDRSMSGDIQPDSLMFRSCINKNFQDEYDKHMKMYQSSIKSLKMSREQRLKEVRSERRTLVDLAEELSNKNVQANVANEIEHLSMVSDEELKRMIENKHVFGEFND
jgi:hypothetical protein